MISPSRLSRAIDRWPGGGQRAFATELRKHVARNGLRIPTSYRTLVNYMNERTRPSIAWIEAAASVLDVSPAVLMNGAGNDAPVLPLLGSEREAIRQDIRSALTQIRAAERSLLELSLRLEGE